MHMQTSGKCQMPEYECQDRIASLRTGENSAIPPMQLLSMHAAQTVSLKDGMGAPGLGGGDNTALSHSRQVLQVLFTQIKVGNSINHSQPYQSTLSGAHRWLLGRGGDLAFGHSQQVLQLRNNLLLPQQRSLRIQRALRERPVLLLQRLALLLELC